MSDKAEDNLKYGTKKYFKQNYDLVVTKVLFTMVSPTGFEPVTH